jgi:hypothetical protein
VDSVARPHPRNHRQPDQQRRRGDHFKVKQCLEPHTPQLVQVAHARDPGRDGAKNNRPNHHPDQLHEPVPQRLHGFPPRRLENSQSHSYGDGDQYLKIQASVNPGSVLDHAEETV